MLLHLGVAEQPYVAYVAPKQRRIAVRTRRRGGKPVSQATYDAPPAGSETTADVARWLEAKYHIMELFYEVYGQRIADRMAESVQHEVDNMLRGAPSSGKPLKAAMADVEKWFKVFITSREVEGLGIPGVPTKAALDGISHRFGKKVSGARRPSFIDTSLFEGSFKAWTE